MCGTRLGATPLTGDGNGKNKKTKISASHQAGKFTNNLLEESEIALRESREGKTKRGFIRDAVLELNLGGCADLKGRTSHSVLLGGESKRCKVKGG